MHNHVLALFSDIPTYIHIHTYIHYYIHTKLISAFGIH